MHIIRYRLCKILFSKDYKMPTIESHNNNPEIDKIKPELNNLQNEVKKERESLKNYIKNVIEESVSFNPLSWFYTKDVKESIIDYIAGWKLNTKENKTIEDQIQKLSENIMNWKLKYLIDSSNRPLINNIHDLKNKEDELKNRFTKNINFLNYASANQKETKKWWDKISEDMFQQLLIMEWGQWYKAQIHGEFWEKFPTWPYGMVYKHIDQKWNLLKNIVPFKNWERVSKEWALNNAKAYYNKRAQEWKKLLNWQWCQYNQAQLDSLVSASWWKQKPVERLKEFVVSHWNDKHAIFNYISNFATTAKWVVQWWLVARRQLEANWFMWTKKSYREYQQEYAENKNKQKKRK